MTLGVAVAAAVLTGALLVGDSMRGSLRAAALRRLGDVTHAVAANRFIREALAASLDTTADSPSATSVCPLILLRGGAGHAASGARVDRVNILGVDERFRGLVGGSDAATSPVPSRQGLIVNAPLARELGVKPGEDVLLRMPRGASISTETLLGRRDDTTVTLRLPVEAVIPDEGGGAFSLRPSNAPVMNAFVALPALQRALGRTGRVNALLVAAGADETGAQARHDALDRSLAAALELDDLGLTVTADENREHLTVQSESLLIEPALEDAVRAAAGVLGVQVSPVFTYLANSLERTPPGTGTDSAKGDDPGGTGSAASIPYSVVSAIEFGTPTTGSFEIVAGRDARPTDALPTDDRPADGRPVIEAGAAGPALRDGEILLNEWAATELAATIGDSIRLTYYITGDFGKLETRSESFTLRDVVALNAAVADPTFAPDYPGITNAETLADWDPPFPMDLKRIRKQDEVYWEDFRTTPKAFVTLAQGRRLWAQDAARFGQSTALRIYPSEALPLSGLGDRLAKAIRERIDARRVGLAFDSVRRQALASSSGNTDFGMLFVGFSFFLIAAAAMLVVLLFRLGMERRAGDLGLLLAAGLTPRAVFALLIGEGAVVAFAGCSLGVLLSLGYAWLMLAGLRSWWADAANAPFLELHAPPATLAIGFAAGLVVSLVSMGVALRGLTRRSPRALLASRGAAVELGAAASHGRRTSGLVVIGGTALAVFFAILPTISTGDTASPSFFGAGACLLVASLAAFRWWMQRTDRTRPVHRPGLGAWLALGARSVRRNAGRSLLTAGLIASAVFVIVSVGAFRLDPPGDAARRDGGTGGFTLYAESAVPLPYDLANVEGRNSLGFREPQAPALESTRVFPLRLRPGDDTSCRSLYSAAEPRILGATETFIDRGGFAFSATLAETDEERANPWTLLRRTFADGAVPVIGDEAAVKWQLHRNLGDDYVVRDEGGTEVRLRFVALLSHSALQDELIVAEAPFTRLFPSVSGHAFFLIETPGAAAREVELLLERELSAHAFAAASTAQRLAGYLAVQNTYLSTFQTLGGLGLLLGSIGMAVVLLRNAWERRGEMALLRALGFTARSLGWMALAENLLLVVVGLAAGVIPAVLAIAPQLLQRADVIPWVSLIMTLGGVLVVGLAAGALAVWAVVRAPLLRALRSE